MTTALINPPTERLGSSHTSMDPRGILKAFPKRKKIHTNPSSKALAKIPKREDREEAGGTRIKHSSARQTNSLLHLLEPVRLSPGQPCLLPDLPPDLYLLPGGQRQLQASKPSSDGETSDGEETQVSGADLEALISGRYPTPFEGDGEPSPAPKGLDKWVCAQPSSQKAINHNPHITEKLEVLAKAYSVQGDKWRALGYAKAINALKSFHKPVTSYQEAFGIPGIGKRMAEKIVEILESGHLRKLDHISESVPVLELFSNIWGAGTKTAQMWYHQGFRSLEDIQNQACLTSQQAIGLKHYDDFLDRMPREEAAEIEQTVREAAQAFNPGLLCVACGSYRRGKATCGDVDVLLTHPDGCSHQGIFSRLLDSLRQQGFLTDDLVSHEENGQQQKYLGVCQLPGPGRRHRRLDIIVVPYSEFACALLYFTGSAHFNRSMRALAKTKGMSLSEHALSTAVVRNAQGHKVGSGQVLPTPTEKDVFRFLGLPYREPAERDW
ncbi:DNA polymerase lambda isoform X3 [Cervus elaphus]|uniref:DNA polymerase lambda isoform X3 n=1 Tax=Cervus canadensis TaxID=1574408 RepID=UPI001C9E5B0B|nr:DNA polymerase lambda isoform X3 [Cervus canadensis]XP_043780761.1 DNA polymerase lambda isoform X3 [Cervus elaphus]